MSDLLWSFFAAAVFQNAVLMTGFGSSVLIRMTRKRTNIIPFGILLCVFAALTMLICYPIDMLIGTEVIVKWIRPLIIIVITSILYIIITLILNKKLQAVYSRIRRLVPIAAFNNLVIGIVIVVNHQFAVSLLGAIGLSLGACAGFLLLSWLMAEGIERLDNSDVPASFRGLPSVLIYLGILALALMGFSDSVSMI